MSKLAAAWMSTSHEEGMERPRCEGEASGGMPAEKIEKQDDDTASSQQELFQP